MTEPFIRNHHYNFIRQQTEHLQKATATVTDAKVLEAVRYGAEAKVIDLFSSATSSQRELLGEISSLKAAGDFQKYLQALSPYLAPFPQVTEKQVKKLFPKNKKLKVPDLTVIDYQAVTYLGWVDIATNKLFIVYPLNGEIRGIEGRFTIAPKKNICSLCHGHGEVALFTAISKTRSVHTSPDYYKAIGNYICTNSHECNKRITDVKALERLIQEITGA
ncbi:FusB/FusC family EF-G-binding protein [Brevibacillus ruminantium]|uniref:FusB/FusC family EF-G-binding protein n=1 Tax=Brevibacillus ruminantium TaxID=2950604 RepID=A0ABY4WE75_9BACL|nr:FusB/FusC family EF-G-binding protein [Brevibacillus ruminantium]USG65039.1 FusB/FusC family EF-G-binding protein [Brevibacillus ruminantium]